MTKTNNSTTRFYMAETEIKTSGAASWHKVVSSIMAQLQRSKVFNEKAVTSTVMGDPQKGEAKVALFALTEEDADSLRNLLVRVSMHACGIAPGIERGHVTIKAIY